MISDTDLIGDNNDVKPVQHNPLEQFILLAKGTRGAGCCDLIKNVLEAPGVYVFAELIQLKSMQELAGSPHEKYLHTLKLFAHGTYQEYLSNQAECIALTDIMIKKLRHLTIVSMAIQNKRLPYADMQEQLGIACVRDLEDLIIEGIYADIIHGKLDQRQKHLEVDYTIGRDIKEEDVKKIADTLKEWCDSCESVLNTFEEQIQRANEAKANFVKHNENLEQEVAKLKGTLKLQLVNELDEDVAMDMKECNSSNSSGASTSAQETRHKRPKSKVTKSSASSGSTAVKMHR